MAQHATELASGPTESRLGASGSTPSIGTRRAVGLNPTMPHIAAGNRHDPPVSVPSAANAMPSATETAAPEDDPPGMRLAARSHGERGVPKCGLMPRPEKANSVMLVRPIGISPAASRRAITGAWEVAGGASASTTDPAGVGSPATSNKSLMLTGMPASGPGARPTRRCASAASAMARAGPA